MSLKQRLSWQIYNQLILLNNLYQISVNSALIKTPVPGSWCMVYKIVGATCFPCLYVFLSKNTLCLGLKSKSISQVSISIAEMCSFPSFITIEEQQQK